MRRAVLSIALGILSGYAWAQDSLLIVKDGEVEKKAVLATPIELNTKAVKFVPYGFIRNDFYYDSRENFETA